MTKFFARRAISMTISRITAIKISFFALYASTVNKYISPGHFCQNRYFLAIFLASNFLRYAKVHMS